MNAGRPRGEDQRVTTIFRNRCKEVHSGRRLFLGINVLDETRQHINLGNALGHKYWKLRMAGSETSVVRVPCLLSQLPYPSWLRSIQRTDLGKPVRTERTTFVTHEWVVGHDRFKIELRIERRSRSVRHQHGDSFIQDTVGGLYSYSEEVSTTLTSIEIFRLKRKKSSQISSRPVRVKV